MAEEEEEEVSEPDSNYEPPIRMVKDHRDMSSRMLSTVRRRRKIIFRMLYGSKERGDRKLQSIQEWIGQYFSSATTVHNLYTDVEELGQTALPRSAYRCWAESEAIPGMRLLGCELAGLDEKDSCSKSFVSVFLFLFSVSVFLLRFVVGCSFGVTGSAVLLRAE